MGLGSFYGAMIGFSLLVMAMEHAKKNTEQRIKIAKFPDRELSSHSKRRKLVHLIRNDLHDRDVGAEPFLRNLC